MNRNLGFTDFFIGRGFVWHGEFLSGRFFAAAYQVFLVDARRFVLVLVVVLVLESGHAA
jgi:hypothetical protein